MTNDDLFTIGAPGVDTARIVSEIRATVERKVQEGGYTDARVLRAERTNLVNLSSDEQFLSFYLSHLREAVFVDISDFEIRERRPLLAPLLIKFKKVIWSLLKFYTYRLWSQQNQVNGLLLTAVESLDEKYRDKIKQLESRLQALEKEQQG